MKKGMLIWYLLGVILLIGAFSIPVTVIPDNETRVIIDHTKKVYSAPACFDQADLTNNLEETTLGFARGLEYVSESSCTDNQFQGEVKPFIIGIFR